MNKDIVIVDYIDILNMPVVGITKRENMVDRLNLFIKNTRKNRVRIERRKSKIQNILQ